MGEKKIVNANSFNKKFFILLGLLVILLIPVRFLFHIVDDRASYKREATNSVQSSWAGPQVISVPQLSVYSSDSKQKTNLKLQDYKVNVNVKTEYRKKGIYNIPVYIADVTLIGSFINAGALNNTPVKLKLDVSDSSGFVAQPEIKLQGKSLKSEESTEYNDNLTTSAQYIPFEIKYQIRGIEKLSVETKAVTNKIFINGNWGNPSFEGKFLPVIKSVKSGKFSAEWSIPKIAMTSIENPNVSVSFLSPVDNYRMAIRALKYAFLFLFLTFMSYFIFELTSKNKTVIHYLQYLMMGVAMLIFYLLLVSISEFIAFKWAYLIASAMTISLISLYTHFVLTKCQNKSFSLLIVGLLSLLYIFLYVLLSLQDFSLILGSFGLFFIIVLVMYSTRNVDWFGNNE